VVEGWAIGSKRSLRTAHASFAWGRSGLARNDRRHRCGSPGPQPVQAEQSWPRAPRAVQGS